MKELAKHKAVLPARGTFTREIIEQAFEQHHVDVDISLSTNYLETIKMLVSVGLGWSVFTGDEHLAATRVAPCRQCIGRGGVPLPQGYLKQGPLTRRAGQDNGLRGQPCVPPILLAQRAHKSLDILHFDHTPQRLECLAADLGVNVVEGLQDVKTGVKVIAKPAPSPTPAGAASTTAAPTGS